MMSAECRTENFRSAGSISAAKHSAFGLRHSAFRALVLAAAALLVAGLTAAPLTLDDAIRLALQRNPALKVSAFSPQIARANLLTEYGRFDPALTFRRNYREGQLQVSTVPLVTSITQTDDYALGLGGLAPWGMSYSLSATANNQRGTFNRFTDNFVTFGGISITQPLLNGFGFGNTLASLRIAKANRADADWLHRQAVMNTVTSVIFAYNNLAQARETLRINLLSRDLASKLLKQYEARNRIGAISDADVIQARASAASRDEAIISAAQAARDRENELRQLIGETAFFQHGPDLELETLPPAVPMTPDVAADLKRAKELRPDYQSGRLAVTRRRLTSTLANNQLLPRLDFIGSYGYSGVDPNFSTARAEVRDRDARAYSAGVAVTIPLTFAEGRGRARSAKLALRQSEADLERIEIDIALDITAAAGQIETTRNRVESSRMAVDLARQSLNAEEKKIQAGTGRTLDVINAQTNLISVERNYAAALADERRARAAYEREIGTTLLMWNIKIE